MKQENCHTNKNYKTLKGMFEKRTSNSKNAVSLYTYTSTINRDGHCFCQQTEFENKLNFSWTMVSFRKTLKKLFFIFNERTILLNKLFYQMNDLSERTILVNSKFYWTILKWENERNRWKDE